MSGNTLTFYEADISAPQMPDQAPFTVKAPSAKELIEKFLQDATAIAIRKVEVTLQDNVPEWLQTAWIMDLVTDTKKDVSDMLQHMITSGIQRSDISLEELQSLAS